MLTGVPTALCRVWSLIYRAAELSVGARLVTSDLVPSCNEAGLGTGRILGARTETAGAVLDGPIAVVGGADAILVGERREALRVQDGVESIVLDVVLVHGPDEEPAQPLRVGKLHLVLERLDVVVGDPLVLIEGEIFDAGSLVIHDRVVVFANDGVDLREGEIVRRVGAGAGVSAFRERTSRRVAAGVGKRVGAAVKADAKVHLVGRDGIAPQEIQGGLDLSQISVRVDE